MQQRMNIKHNFSAYGYKKMKLQKLFYSQNSPD